MADWTNYTRLMVQEASRLIDVRRHLQNEYFVLIKHAAAGG